MQKKNTNSTQNTKNCENMKKSNFNEIVDETKNSTFLQKKILLSFSFSTLTSKHY